LSTKLLIETRHKFDSKFEDKVTRQGLLWDRVAAEMLEIGSYVVSGSAANTKWNNLTKTYRSNQDKAHTSGEGAVRWEFFDLMKELFGKKSSSEPHPGQLQSSFLVDKPASPGQPTAGSSDSKSTAATRTQGPKRKANSDEPPAWFLSYIKQKKIEDLAKENRIMAEQRRIQALEEEKVLLLREYLKGQKKD
jgi:hypothetical protein